MIIPTSVKSQKKPKIYEASYLGLVVLETVFGFENEITPIVKKSNMMIILTTLLVFMYLILCEID